MKMHGPETAACLRRDFNFTGRIIGSQFVIILPVDNLALDINALIFTIDFLLLILRGPAGITGNALPKDIASFLAGGANEVLTKPLTKAKLVNALQSYL